MLDGPLDGIGNQALLGGAVGQLREFFVAREPQRDNLAYVEPRVQQLAGQRVMPQVLLRADGTILRDESEFPAIVKEYRRDEDQQKSQRRGVNVGMADITL